MVILIPCRISSKGVPLKNLRSLGGYPLLLWSIAAARLLEFPTFVTTDSNDIANLCEKYDVACYKIAERGHKDDSTDKDIVVDFLTIKPGSCGFFTVPKEIKEIILFRPTTPFRNPVLLKDAIGQWQAGGYDSLCSGHILTESADKYFKWNRNGKLADGIKPYNDSIKLEDIHLPRQSRTETIQGNGVIDIFKTGRIGEGILWGEDMLGFITPYTPEIDTEYDLEWCNFYLKKHGHCLWDYLKAVYGG